MGSWPFVFGFFAVIGAWVVVNSVLALNTDDIKDLIGQNLHLIQEMKRQTDLLDEIHRHVAGLGTPGVLPRPGAEELSAPVQPGLEHPQG